MKKVTLSFQLLAAIVAVTILQACAGTACAVPRPTLTPQSHNGRNTVNVTIRRPAEADHMVFWIVGSQIAIQTAQPSVQVWVNPSPSPGRKLKAKAIRAGVYSLAAVGTYYY